MQTYKDYIGVKIEYVIGPYQYRSAQEALEDRLKYYIKNELTCYNGLICAFKNIQTEVSAGMIIVSGTILRRRGKRILIEFVISDWTDDKYLPVTMIRWFKKRRRQDGGVYECHGMNYWYYANMGKYYEEIVATGLDN